MEAGVMLPHQRFCWPLHLNRDDQPLPARIEVLEEDDEGLPVDAMWQVVATGFSTNQAARIALCLAEYHEAYDGCPETHELAKAFAMAGRVV